MERPILSAILLLLLVMTGCATTDPLIEVEDGQALVNFLESEGVRLYDDGPVSQTFLSSPGQAFTVSGGGTLQIYEYRSEASAALDIRQIDPSEMSPPGRPAFYRRGRLIVIYTGNDPMIEQHLRTVLSQEFP